MKNKIIVVLGQTATGKSDLAVLIAQKFNGEVISADSRQVYRGLDIGTGKITKREMKGIIHHLLDVADPKQQFSVAQYKKLAEKAIIKIISAGKIPILCGGTGFYIDSIISGISLPSVPPNRKLRGKLSKKSTNELFKMLKKLDPKRASEIDSKNPHRLIRAIEVAKTLGKVPVPVASSQHLASREYETLKIGIKIPDEELKERINKRLIKRIESGMITEAKNLHKGGFSYKRMREMGLEYGRLADFLQNKITKSEMIKFLKKEIWQYAKRQMTWFKRDTEIKWFTLSKVEGFDLKEAKKIETEIKKFLKKF